nr:DUF3352 domain-containing protein [Allomuricauda sp.]
MSKKRILFGLLGLLVLYLCYLAYIFIFSPKINLQSIYLIPKDAVFVIESDKPVESWGMVSQSKAWKHLQKNEYVADLTNNIQKVDTVFNNNHRLFEFFDGRSLFISIHMISQKDYGIFYVLDLKRIAKLKLLKTYLNTLLNENYKMSRRQYHDHEILEVYDQKNKQTLYLAFVKNQMVASYTHTLVEASIDQYQEPFLGRDLQFLEINSRVGYEDLFRLYVQYDYLDDYFKRYSTTENDWIERISENLLFSGFHLDLDENSLLTANGYTNLGSTQQSYVAALQKSGMAKRTVPQVAPEGTSLYISYGFDGFDKFYGNFEKVQQEHPEQFEQYQDGIGRVEKFLKINIKENFVSWIGDEIALLQIPSKITADKSDMALVLQTNDAEDAKTHLDFVLKQIKKKTPVKFKAIDYKGYQINYLSIKGFFKILLGNRFKEFDKPYFAQLGDFVIFSNSPNTLKSLIDDLKLGKTLSNSKEFQVFDDRFERSSSLFIYGNIPYMYNGMKALADAPTQSKMHKNKDFILCFPQIGFQLRPEDDLFESRLVIKYQELDKSNNVSKNTKSVSPGPKIQESGKKEITASVFDLKPIYPADLNSKSFAKKYGNGNFMFEVELKDGLKHGKYEAFYPSGSKKMTGRFKKDGQVGTWRYFDEKGELILKKKF